MHLCHDEELFSSGVKIDSLHPSTSHRHNTLYHNHQPRTPPVKAPLQISHTRAGLAVIIRSSSILFVLSSNGNHFSMYCHVRKFDFDGFVADRTATKTRSVTVVRLRLRSTNVNHTHLAICHTVSIHEENYCGTMWYVQWKFVTGLYDRQWLVRTRITRAMRVCIRSQHKKLRATAT